MSGLSFPVRKDMKAVASEAVEVINSRFPERKYVVVRNGTLSDVNSIVNSIALGLRGLGRVVESGDFTNYRDFRADYADNRIHVMADPASVLNLDAMGIHRDNSYFIDSDGVLYGR